MGHSILYSANRDISKKSIGEIAYNNTVEHQLLDGVFNWAVTRMSKAIKQIDDNNDNDSEH